MLTDMKQYVEQRRVEMGHRLREARNRAGWTQGQAAEYLGCSRTTITRVENGHLELSGLQLELLAMAYKVPITYFYSQVTSYPTAPAGQ